MSFFNFQPPFSGVVRHLVIINVLVFFATRLLMPNGEWIQFAMFVPGSPYFEPYQIATHMFMHANFSHLLFNMLSLYFFGPMVEMVWGHQRFLMYYLTCGIGSMLLHFGITYIDINNSGMSVADYGSPMLGASGAIFGIYVAFAYLFPNQEIRLLFPPIALKAKYFVAIIAALELFYGISGYSAGVAHYAHLGGALAGFLLIGLWTGFRFK